MRAVLAVLIALAVAGLGAAGPPEEAKPLQPVVYVDALGGCRGNTPCETGISAGVQRVSPGGLVFVYAFGGAYPESVLIPKPLTLRGEDPATVIVDAGFAAAVVDVQADGVTVENFTLVQGRAGLAVDGFAGTTVRDVTVEVADLGLSVRNASGVTVTRTTVKSPRLAGFDLWNSGAVSIDGSTVADGGAGLLATATTDFTATRSVILRSAGPGIGIRGSTRVTLDGNNVSDGGGRGIWVDGGLTVTVRGNDLWNNGFTGLNVSGSVDVTVEGNRIVGNGALGFAPGPVPIPFQTEGGGLWFWLTDPVTVRGNVVERNRFVGIGIGGPASTDYTLAGNVVRGNDGPGLRLTAKAARIDVAGDFLGNRGDGIAIDNVTAVAIHDATLEGNLGFGVRGNASVAVSIANSVIRGNGGSGGGLWFWLTDPSEIRGNTITGNGGPGVTLDSTTDFDVVGNTIDGNAGDQVALLSATRSRVLRNTIGNGSAGATVAGSSDVTFAQNTIQDNAAGLAATATNGLSVYHNDFLRNALQAADDRGSANAWDNGYPSGGNFWSDYTGPDRFSGPNQDQPGSDGFGDTPYGIDADSADRYPFVTRTSVNAPPSCSLLAPGPTAVWSGGSVHTIAWAMDDDRGAANLVAFVNWSTPMTNGRIAGPLVGATSTSWSVPSLDSAAVRVHLNVIDSMGSACGTSTLPFTVDSTAPAITATDPAEGAQDVEAGSDVRITFSEDMNRTATDGSLTLEVGGAVVTFQTLWSGPLLILRPTGFVALDADAVVTVGTTARDASDPGNPLPSAFLLRFHTAAFLDVTPPTARAGGPYAAEVGVPVRFDGRGSTDDVGVENWTWVVAGPGTSVTLFGSQPSHAFGAPGEYAVTLTVRDGAGNAASDVTTLTVSQPFPVAIAAAGVLVLAGLLAAAVLLLLRRRRRGEGPPPGDGVR